MQEHHDVERARRVEALREMRDHVGRAIGDRVRAEGERELLGHRGSIGLGARREVDRLVHERRRGGGLRRRYGNGWVNRFDRSGWWLGFFNRLGFRRLRRGARDDERAEEESAKANREPHASASHAENRSSKFTGRAPDPNSI